MEGGDGAVRGATAEGGEGRGRGVRQIRLSMWCDAHPTAFDPSGKLHCKLHGRAVLTLRVTFYHDLRYLPASARRCIGPCAPPQSLPWERRG